MLYFIELSYLSYIYLTTILICLIIISLLKYRIERLLDIQPDDVIKGLGFSKDRNLQNIPHTQIISNLPSLQERSPVVYNAIWRIVEYIIRDWITYWYVKVGDDKEFPNNIRALIEYSLSVLTERASKADWPVLFARVLVTFRYMLRMFKITIDKIKLERPDFYDLDEEVRNKILIENIPKHYKLHEAVSNSNINYLRQVTCILLSHILHPDEYRGTPGRSLMTEIIACKVLSPLMYYARPYWVNVGINYLDTIATTPCDSTSKTAIPEKTPNHVIQWSVEKTKRLKRQNKSNEGYSKDDSEIIIKNQSHQIKKSESDLLSNETSDDQDCRIYITEAVMQFNPKPYVVYRVEVMKGKRYRQFEELHSQLKKSLTNFDAKLPKKKLFGNLEDDFVESRRHELQKYLEEIISRPDVMECDVFLDFLRPEVDLPTHQKSRINPIFTSEGGIDDIESKQPPIQRGLSADDIQVQNITHKSTLTNISPPILLNRKITQPLYDLIDEIFQLTDRGWVNRQASWLATQILEISLDGFFNNLLNRKVNEITSQDTLVWLINFLSNKVWPDGELYKTSYTPTIEEETEQLNSARDNLLKSFPSYIQIIVGKSACDISATRLFEFFQFTSLVQHMAYSVFDAVLDEMNLSNPNELSINVNSNYSPNLSEIRRRRIRSDKF